MCNLNPSIRMLITSFFFSSKMLWYYDISFPIRAHQLGSLLTLMKCGSYHFNTAFNVQILHKHYCILQSLSFAIDHRYRWYDLNSFMTSNYMKYDRSRNERSQKSWILGSLGSKILHLTLDFPWASDTQKTDIVIFMTSVKMLNNTVCFVASVVTFFTLFIHPEF